jgi:hypothetical protein
MNPSTAMEKFDFALESDLLAERHNKRLMELRLLANDFIQQQVGWSNEAQVCNEKMFTLNENSTLKLFCVAASCVDPKRF